MFNGLDQQQFSGIASAWVSTVSLVTSGTPQQPITLITPQVTIVDPMQQFVGLTLQAESPLMQMVMEKQAFAVHLLDARHAPLIQHYALMSSQTAPPIAWTTAQTGSPILVDTTAWLDCTLQTHLSLGSTVYLIGKTVAGRVNAPNAPFMFGNRPWWEPTQVWNAPWTFPWRDWTEYWLKFWGRS